MSDNELKAIENLAKSFFVVNELDVQENCLAKDLKNALIKGFAHIRKKDLVGFYEETL